MNTELLRKVQKAILEEPARINMDGWLYDVTTADDLEAFLDDVRDYDEEGNVSFDPPIPPCGTVGCIAGWTYHLEGLPRPEKWINYNAENGEFKPTLEVVAAERLGLSAKQAATLFYPDRWPIDLSDRLYANTPGSPEYAKVVSDVIDRFIEQGGKWDGGEVEEDDWDEY